MRVRCVEYRIVPVEPLLDTAARLRLRWFLLYNLIVWEPILATDWKSPSGNTLARIPDRRARQFWDPEHVVASALKPARGPSAPGAEPELLNCGRPPQTRRSRRRKEHDQPRSIGVSVKGILEVAEICIR